jgi:hypothetical protein
MSKKYPGGFVTNLGTVGNSVFFDGTGDGLNCGSNAAFAFGTGPFCIEFWMYNNVLKNYSCGVTTRPNNGNYSDAYHIGWDATGGISLYVGTTSSPGASAVVKAGQWQHFVCCRNASNVTSIFIDGVRVGTATNTSDFTRSLLGVGDFPTTPAEGINGYLSNVRLVKGSSVYDPTQTSLIVPTQLLNIPNTSLLTCNSPALVDQSPTNATITANGTPAVSTFTPFPVYNAYNPALGASTPGVWTLDQALQAAATRQWNMYDPYFNLTTLYLPGNGTNGAQNNTFLDGSTNNFTITRNGNTTQGTFSPFSQTGWTGFFDGSSVSTVASNAAFNLSSGTWTVEGWFYLTSAPGKPCRALMIGTNNNLNSYVALAINTDLTFGAGVPFAGTGVVSGTTTLPLNRWNHVAIVMDNSTGSAYLNGVRVGNQAGCTQMNNTNNFLAIGQDSSEVTVNAIYAGYISNLRIVKGVAVYSGTSFTVPTSPLAAISGTSFLTYQNNRFIDNGSSLTITPGGVSIQAFSPFFPTAAYSASTIGGSGYFDGTGDYLVSGATSVGSSNFTVEFWFYPTTFAAFQYPLYSTSSGAKTDVMAFEVNTSGGMIVYLTRAGSGPWSIINAGVMGTLQRNAWNHVAFVRNGTAFRGYVNGVQGALSTTSSDTVETFNGFSVGAFVASGFCTGYISGVRQVVGTAVYTAAFTPPTAPPTAVTNTQLLLNFTNAGITDATSKNVLETVGNAQISTTQSKWGGASMSMSSGGYLVGPKTDLTSFGTGDFTMECWVYFNVNNAFQGVIATGNQSTGQGTIRLSSGGKLQALMSGTAMITGATTVSTSTWHHVALTRSGTSLRLFLNGVQDGSATDSNSYTGTGGVFVGNDTGNYLNGFVDDVRITKGFARYTANFTPPTSALQQQ